MCVLARVACGRMGAPRGRGRLREGSRKADKCSPRATQAVAGVKAVQRVVCGGCLDFKIITTLDADSFGEWEGKSFEPEASILEEMKAIDGVSLVETQTFTLMPM